MQNLNKNQETILEYIAKHNEVTPKKLQNAMGIPLRTLQRALKKLVDLRLVKALGTTHDRSYRRVYNENDVPFNFIVFKSGERVGMLLFGKGEYVFNYSQEYNGESLEGLDKNKTNKAVELFPYFENLIPEYKRRERLAVGKEDLAEVLLDLTNSHGALDFVAKHKLFEYKPNYGKRKNWITVKNKILLDNKFPNLIEAAVLIEDEILNASGNTEHSDLSGYQTKVDVNYDEQENTIKESKSAQYLLKPRNKDKNNYFNHDKEGTKHYYPYISINEHLFMTFAKNELHFDVPYSGIIKAKDVDFHYITKRYDRIDGLKYNQVDFAQVLGVSSEQKYKSSSEILFRAINEKLTSAEAKMNALKFYYYSYLIKHSDLHLKNIGALEIGMQKYVLAPLYDVISVGIYEGNTDDLGLPMKEPFKKAKNWKLDDFIKLAGILNISANDFTKQAKNITRIFIKKMPEYIAALKEFEVEHPLPIQKTRAGTQSCLSQRVESMYIEKIIRLKKLGIIKELGLVEIAGGLLSVQKNS